MTSTKKVIAITGSTRGQKTASESIVNYLAKKLESEGVSLNKIRAHQIFKDEEKIQLLVKEIEKSDFLFICSPVYVHSLPYPLLSLMESLSKKDNKYWEKKKMMVIIHSGYPEDIQRKASIEICTNFATEKGIKWLGAIGFGGSPIIDGKPLEDVGGFTKWMRKAIDEMSKSIIKGEEISEEAKKYARKHFPSIPLSILKILLNMRVKSMARKNGINLYEQPYLTNS